MADPLSIAASIAGVISLADIVFIRTRKYLSSAKNTDKEVKDLSQEVLLLGGALHSLSRLAQALDANGLKDMHIDNLRMHHIAACHATLDEVAKKLKKLEDNATKRKLVWPFVSDRTKELLAEISRHKQNIDLALTADSLGTLLQVLSRTEEAQVNTEKMLDEAKKTREIVTRIRHDSKREEILKYFLPYNPQQNYEMSLYLRHPRTGLWLTRKPELQTWLEHPDSALWLSGIPGAGKTVLAGTIIEEALKRSSEDISTMFFFCDYKNTKTQTLVNILSALAFQLALQKEAAYGYLDRYYRELHPKRALERRPDVSGLQRILKDMVKSFDHVYLIVDGLDECGDNTDNVIDGILDIVECSDNISTALLSRDEDNIRDRLEDNFTGIEIAAHTEDITEYVTSEIEKRISNKSLRIDDLNLKGEILERLIGGAEGMFRWVACQLDFLGDCLSDKECRDALGQLPPGLNESYMRILQRVPIGKERTVQMILNFIAHAKPMLDTPKLREVCSVPENAGDEIVMDLRCIVREDSITRLCRSLIRKSNDGRYYEFAHFSVQEFLEREMKAMPELEKFQVSESICQLLLAKQCLKYLLLQNFSSPPTVESGLKEHINRRIKQHPFYLYAAVRWPVFAKGHWTDGRLVELAELLFQPTKTGNFMAWALELTSFIEFAFQTPTRPFMLIKYRANLDESHLACTLRVLPKLVNKNFTSLHMAAALSLPVLCASLIGKGSIINQQTDFGSPLQCAVQGMLLSGLSQNARLYHRVRSLWGDYTDSYGPGKADPSEFGRDNTIRLLLKSGANHATLCSGPFKDQTLFTVSLRLGYALQNVSAIGILLEAGYVLEEDDLNEFTKFRAALVGQRNLGPSVSEYGLENLIICLNPIIDRSAIHFRLCQLAWSLAIEMGCKFAQDPYIVDTRIALSQDTLAKTIFASVRDADYAALTKALKDPRADLPNLTNRRNESPFDVWVALPKRPYSSMELDILYELLSAGIEVNKPNHEGLLPIHRLASRVTNLFKYRCGISHFKMLGNIVSEFTRRGTGCSALSRANQNVLHLGLESIDLVMAVLETETEESILKALRTRDDQGNTPITLALRDGWDDVALLLLEKSQCDSEALRGPASVHVLCVAGGAHRAFNFLLSAGITLDACSEDIRNKPLLHHLGPRTSKEFLLQLTQMFPGGTLCRVDGKLPLDVYLESCITCESPALDPDVLQLLTASGSNGLDQREKTLSWEHFMMMIQHMTRITEVADSTRRVVEQALEDTIARAIAALLQLGFMQSYEAVAHAAGPLLLLKPIRDSLDDLWPVSGSAIYDILEKTVLWESLREAVSILRLLKAAIKSGNVGLVWILLENGVSVHQRIDEMSALEVACLYPAHSLESKRAFALLLNHADSSRLDEINPCHGQQQGLLHYLAGPLKQWQLDELLKRGVDVNSRARINTVAKPAIVHHILAGCLESAMILLENGADPTTTDECGMDAALAAAFEGDLAFLLHLNKAECQGWQVNWQRTFSGWLLGADDIKLEVSTINALHLAAWSGHVDVLKFYVDTGLLTDLNSVSVELLTPTHLAAFNGKIDVFRFLCSRGCGLDLKSADGSLPLHLAVRNGHTNVVKLLLDHGSAIDADVHGLSPVAYAMQLQNQPILNCLRTSKQFLDHQYDPKQHYKDVVYAFEQALIRGDLEYCQALRSQGFPINVDLPGQSGRSPLILAIENTKEELIKWLLTHDVKGTEKALNMNTEHISPLEAIVMRPALSNILPLLLRNYKNEGGPAIAETPSLICIAIQCDNNPGLKLLLDHTARLETTNSMGHQVSSWTTVNRHKLDGATALHWAARTGNCEAVKLLLDHGADVDALDSDQMTPLQRAIISEPLKESPAAKLLLLHGSALENRNDTGETAIMCASRQGLTELVCLLDDAGADLMATDFSSWNCLHFAADNGHLDLLVWLVNRGIQLHTKTWEGWSAFHYASFHKKFTSFLLNFDFAFENTDAMTYANPGHYMSWGPAWLNEHFNMYLRRLGPERLRALANLEPTDSWSPLCILASMGQTLAMDNILKLGAIIDFDGSAHGSALMAACSSGRLESVKILVRHRAAISNLGRDGIQSAVDAARNHKAILAWLLVDRFTEQGKLADPADSDSGAHSAKDVKPWSGVVQKELIITDIAQRQVHESSRDYWFRLMAIKKDWRGKVVEQHKLVRTHRPSRLIPEESVRICPGDYGTPKEKR